MPDSENTSASSTEDSEVKDESLEASEADTDETSEEDESEKPSKRDKRIQQLLSQRKEAQDIINWYRENIGDPNDVVEFRKWKNGQLKEAKEQAEEGEITPARLKSIRELMRKADPEYAEFMERQKQEQESRIESQFDAAADEIRDLAKEIGIPAKNEAAVSRLAKQVMMEIREDPKLNRMWQAGNMGCIKKAFNAVRENFIEVIRKSTPVQQKQAAEKRSISRLPTLPAAQGTISGSEKRKPDDKGLTKSAHDEAWAILQQRLAE